MTEEIAPCPFCEDGGKPFPYIDRQPKMAYTVKCYVCHAQGPLVAFETAPRRTWEEVATPAKETAIRRWNEYQSHLVDPSHI